MKADDAEQSAGIGGASFATTHWSLVCAAQGEPETAREALEQLCRIYWRPIFSFIRREGRTVEDAQDLTQGFFAELLEHRDFDDVRREKGRLRSYLLVALKHFLVDARERATAIKRGGGRRLISLDDLTGHQGMHLEPAESLTAELIYERRWALTVLDQALDRLAKEYKDSDSRARLFSAFTQFLAGESDGPSQAEIAHELKMTENAVKQAYHRFRRRYRELLREEIAHTVAVPGDIEDELRQLVAILRM